MLLNPRKSVILFLLLLAIAALSLALRQRKNRALPTPAYCTNNVGTLYARVRMPRDFKFPGIYVTNLHLSGKTFLATTNGWIEDSNVQSLRWNSSTGYTAVAAIPWERKWKFELRAIHYRRLQIGPLNLALAPQTNVWLSSELPSRNDLLQRSNLNLFPLPD